MTSYKDVVYSAGLFKASDLTEPKLLTIESAALEEVGQHKEEKLVLRFVEDKRGCVVNGERGMAVEAIAGTDDFTQWVGWKVVLEEGRTRFQGKMTPCVSIRSPKQKQSAPHPVEIPPDIDGDDIPF
jgi:hypothetical protein